MENITPSVPPILADRYGSNPIHLSRPNPYTRAAVPPRIFA